MRCISWNCNKSLVLNPVRFYFVTRNTSGHSDVNQNLFQDDYISMSQEKWMYCYLPLFINFHSPSKIIVKTQSSKCWQKLYFSLGVATSRDKRHHLLFIVLTNKRLWRLSCDVATVKYKDSVWQNLDKVWTAIRWLHPVSTKLAKCQISGQFFVRMYVLGW